MIIYLLRFISTAVVPGTAVYDTRVIPSYFEFELVFFTIEYQVEYAASCRCCVFCLLVYDTSYVFDLFVSFDTAAVPGR